MSVGRARRHVRALVRVTSAGAVLLVFSVWAALPASAGDPLGEITEFTAGLSPNSEPNRIAAGPDGNLWFTENANPGRIGKIGAGCVPAPAPIATQPRFTG
jgi:streptogramin lyase